MAGRLKTGLHVTDSGFRAFVRVRGQLYTKRFPKDATITEMRDWRASTRTDKLREAVRQSKRRAGTFADDVNTYLAAVRNMPTYKWRQTDLDAWVAEFGARKRPSITADEIRAVLQRWRLSGKRLFRPWCNLRTRKAEMVEVGRGPLSESACNHRRTALMHLWNVLDGKSAPNPLKDVPRLREPDPQPRGVPMATVQRILDAMPDSATKARCLVMAWTGLPHASLMQLTAASVDFTAKTVYVPRRRKGKGTKARVVPLLPQAVRAFKQMVKWDAWGKFSRDSLRRSLALACEKAGVDPIRPYDLRHSFASAAYAAGGDIHAVQALLDHSDVKLTARYALSAIDQRVLNTLHELRKVTRPVTKRKKVR